MRRFLILLFFSLFVLNGCQFLLPDNEDNPEITLTNHPADPIDADGGSFVFIVNATHPWEAYFDDSWVSLDPSTGAAGTTEVTLFVQENDTHENRNSQITFNCEDLYEVLNIEQMQDGFIELHGNEAYFDAIGGYLEIGVKSNIPYEISVETAAQGWIISDETRLMNTQSHVFSISNNTETEPRKGSIYITGDGQDRTFIVYQEGFVPEIFVYENDYYLSKEGGNIEVIVEANCDVEVHYSAEWVHYNIGDKEGCHHFSIDPNNDLKAREAVISFKNDLYGICEEVRIIQGCDEPFIVASPSRIDIPATSNTFDIKIENNVEVEVNVNMEWIAFIGKNGNIYSFSANENNTTENNRKALITFSNKEYNVSSNIAVYQENIKNFTPSQGSYTINYTAQNLKIDYYSTSYFSISTDAEWIKTTDSIFAGNNSLFLSVEENTEKTTREADIIVSDSANTYKFTIIQTGKPTNNGSIDDMDHIEW